MNALVLVFLALGQLCIGAALALHPASRPIPRDPARLARHLVGVGALLIIVAFLVSG